MQTEFREFIKHIKYQRIYSDKTVLAYQKDLLQFESFLLEQFNQSKIAWKYVNKNLIRQFLGMLNSSGLQRRSIARKIAALKSFFRFINQNGSIGTDRIAVKFAFSDSECDTPHNALCFNDAV